MLRGRDLLYRHAFADFNRGKCLLIFERASVTVAFLARFTIEGEVALEFHNAAGGPEQIRKRSLTARRRLREIEIDRSRIEHRRRHLRRNESLPDQLIELELIGGEIALNVFGPTRGISRTNCFVRFLRVFGFSVAVQLDCLCDEFVSEQHLHIIARLTRGSFRHAC